MLEGCIEDYCTVTIAGAAPLRPLSLGKPVKLNVLAIIGPDTARGSS